MESKRSLRSQYENASAEASKTSKEIMLTSVTRAMTTQIIADRFSLDIFLISRVDRIRVREEVTKNKSIIKAEPAPKASDAKCIENITAFISFYYL